MKGMKRFFLIYILFGCLQSTAQTTIQSAIRLTDSTGFGIPIGGLTSKQIGTTGGKIISDDGRVELVFPEGALSEDRMISVQSVTNLFDSAAGNAYRFEPGGIQFKKAVQIIFHYSDEENNTCPADLMSFAMQDHTGKWTMIEYDNWDSVAKTLKGNIHHFSSFTNVFKIQLQTKMVIRVDDNVEVKVLNRGVVIKSGEYAGSHPAAQLYAPYKREWFANGVAGGNVYEGKIDEVNFTMGKEVIVVGVYYAPSFLPQKNPVRISLGIRYYSNKVNAFVWRFCHCKIIVYDMYAIKVEHIATGRIGMEARVSDSATFVAVIMPNMAGRHVFLERIKNYSPVIINHGRKGPFREIMNVDGATGSVDVPDKPKVDKVSNDYPPEVYFEFPLRQVLWHKSEYKAPGVKIEPVSINAIALPLEISFIANGLPQVYDSKTYGTFNRGNL